MQQQSNPMMNQGQGNVMMQPPAKLSVKDHLYLSDMLSWNLMSVKKANFFAQQCQDQEIKQAIQNMMMMHQRHYQKILTHLQKDVTSQMQPSGQPQAQGQPQMGGMQ